MSASKADNHARSVGSMAARGRIILISVNWPGYVSTSIDPPCCLTMMSWLMDRPRPSAFSGRLRREERIEHLLLHLGRNAGAVVADPDFHAVPEVLGRGSQGRLVVASVCFRFALGRRIEAVGDQVQQRPRDVLREDVGFASRRIQVTAPR